MTEPVPWNQLVPGKRYRIAFSGSDSIATLRYVKKGPGGAVVLFDRQAPWIGPNATEPIWFRMPDDASRIKIYPADTEKEARALAELSVSKPEVPEDVIKYKLAPMLGLKEKKTGKARRSGRNRTRRRRKRRSTA
jgi:hypothetical protein